VALLAGCGGGPQVDLRDRGVVNKHYPIAIHDVSYESVDGGRVPGYLVVPPGKGPFPAVLYLHGSGGDRVEWLAPATWMAARGAVTLTVDDPFARDPGLQVGTGLAGVQKLHDVYLQELADLRRAVDVLQSLPYVDGKRIAFVGFSGGARMGAILAGSERRIRAFDLISGGGVPAQAFVEAAPPSARKGVARAFEGLDDLAEIRRAHARFLFQDGLRDEVVPHAQLVALAAAAPQPKELRWYPTGHEPGKQALRDQLEWLSRRLGLDGAVVRGAVAGP
jgi:cephalosporin-C deacetylase-like acetyl esterase